MAPSTRSPAKNPSNPKTPSAEAVESVSVQRTAKCRTLGNGSQLTYQIGADTNGEDHVRMTVAAGGGFFSQEWVSLAAILTALDDWPADRPLTSNALAPLFRGKSANNPSFLAAVLVSEGVLQKKEGRKRHLERCQPNDATQGFDGYGTKRPATTRKRTTGSKKSAGAGDSHSGASKTTPPRKATKAGKK
ncbi:MAG: hypothetical protein AAF662_03120 [Pseudomonadota bacterium]